MDFCRGKKRSNAASAAAFDSVGRTPLHLAAAAGSLDAVRLLLLHPTTADVDPRDLSGGRTPLYLAARGGHAACCELLLQHGASLGIRVAGKATVGEVMKEAMPYFDATRIKVLDRYVLIEHTVHTVRVVQRLPFQIQSQI